MCIYFISTQKHVPILLPSQVAGLIPMSFATGHTRKWPALASFQVLNLLWARSQGVCACCFYRYTTFMFLCLVDMTLTLSFLSLSGPEVRRCASDPAVWAGSLGHLAGGHWLHWGGDDAFWCSTGRKRSCWRGTTMSIKCIYTLEIYIFYFGLFWAFLTIIIINKC